MKTCDVCGCEIPPGAEVRDEVIEPGLKGAGRTVERTLCPECARRRAGLAGFLFKIIGLLLIGMGVIGLIGWLMR
jgi:hypothetical protein